MKYDEWSKLLSTEKQFWQLWFSNNGWHWPDDFVFRFKEDTEIQPHIAIHLSTGDENILDVGSGPVTMLGKRFNGKELNIISTDILAEEYALMFSKAGFHIPNPPMKVAGEELSEFFGNIKFDIVHAQNSIDHCFDPVKVISEMVKVLAPNGVIILTHEVCEGRNEDYQGLHQWNFDLEDNRFVIWNHYTKTVIEEAIPEINIKTSVDDGYITNVIKHK